MLKKRIILSVCRGRVFPIVCLLTSLLILYVILVNEKESRIDKVSQAPLLGHVLTLSFTGQQMAGVRGLISQQCWMKAFNLNMAIVTPFFHQSHLIHSKQLWEDFVDTSERKQSVDLQAGPAIFGTYFDKDYFNERSQKDGKPQLVGWNHFLKTGAKSLIVLNIQNIFKSGCLSYGNERMCKNNEAPWVFWQFTSGCTPSQSTLTSINYLKSIGFKVVRQVCLNCQFGMDQRPTPSQIVQHIFGTYNSNEVTLLINQWKFSIQMTPTCSSNYLCKAGAFKTDLLPNKSLLLDVKMYLNNLYFTISTSPPKLTVGIMIRIEWLLISKKGASTLAIQDCLNSIYIKYKSLVTLRATEMLPLLALDIGRFGSSSFNSTSRIHSISAEHLEEIIRLMKGFVSRIYDGKLTFEQWEQTFKMMTTAVYDGGYVATVQSTIASSADCLMLIGGGHFQQMTQDRYLNRQNGNTRCLFHLCR